MAKQQWRHLLVNIAHGGFPADNGFIQPSNWSPKSESRELFKLGALQQFVCRQKIKDIDHMKLSLEQLQRHDQPWTNQRCDWQMVKRLSFVCTVDTFDITYVNSVISACCRLYFCRHLHWKCRRYWCFLISSLTYYLLRKEYLIAWYKHCNFRVTK